MPATRHLLLIAFLACAPARAGAAQVTLIPAVKDPASFVFAHWNPWAVRVPPILIPEPARQAFPRFALPVWLPDGPPVRTVSLPELGGHVVLLDFWSRSCPACVPLHEAIMRDAPGWKAMGVEVVTILSEEDPAGLADFFEAHGGLPPFPVLIDRRGAVLASLGTAYFPRLEVLDIYGRRAVSRLDGYGGLPDLPPLFRTLLAAGARPVAR